MMQHALNQAAFFLFIGSPCLLQRHAQIVLQTEPITATRVASAAFIQRMYTCMMHFKKKKKCMPCVLSQVFARRY